MPAPLSAIICFCTVPERETAERIAGVLVDEHLAACVNVLPGVSSVYRWKGKVERTEETLLMIKTVRERLDALSARVAQLHPYELPEVIAVEAAGGLPAYLDWVAQQTREENR